MEIATKAIYPQHVKFDDDTGDVVAAFAQFNVIDHDGDVTLPGFFGEQKAAIAVAHDRSRLVGKGEITEKDGWAIFDGKFFLDTIEGREAYLTAKAMGDLQEWSYGFHLNPGGYSFGEFEGKQVRFLQPTKDGEPGARIPEVSTVLVGAGIGTHTVGIKQQGLRFVEQAEQVAQAAETLIARADEIAQMRAEKGKTLGDEAVARLIDVKTRIENVAAMLPGLIDEPHSDDPELASRADWVKARAAFARHSASIHEGNVT